jgi:N-acetylglutamate synthase-like GNAT family acetyltransferase
MNNDISISVATESDISALVQLVNSAYRGPSSKKGWTTEADLLDGVRTDPNTLLEQLKQTEQTILKATDISRNIIGCVSLQKKKDTLYLGMLTVQPDIQATGIGKKLLLAAEDFARNHAIYCIEMTVISVRHELIAWYQRRGFELTGEKRAFPTDPKFGIKKQDLEFVVLEKKLG